MGAFFLLRDDVPDRLAARLAALSADMADQGHGAPVALSAPGVELRVYAKQTDDAPNVWMPPGGDGDFCVATGSLLYRDGRGADALARLHGDLRGGTLDPNALFGTFCLIAAVDGKVTLWTDRMGTYPVWHDTGMSVISSSFLAVARAAERLTLRDQCVYEYVFQGATYGGETLFHEVSLLDSTRGWALAARGAEAVAPLPAPAVAPPPARRGDEAAHLDRVLDPLRRYFRAIAAAFGGKVDTALSGGYDSRLTLALLREQGVTPHVHVYGSEQSADVRVARAVTEGEGIALKHQDKGLAPRITPERLAQVVADNFAPFQGHPPDGLFENGTDLETRASRCAGGVLMLNGGGGEVFRNFFYLPDRPVSTLDLANCFYSGFDPAVCAGPFHGGRYLRTMADKLGRTAGVSGDVLSRRDVEFLYAGFRCRFWMGRNNGVNNRLGWSLTPFIDAAVVPAANDVPIGLKNHGRFEAAMIHAVDPALAAYASDYGHDFSGPPPLKRVVKDWTTLARPPILRRYSYRLRRRTRAGWPYLLGPGYVAAVVDPAFPRLSRYFRVDRVNDPAHFARICTLEYLLDRLKVS
ncbi:MAG: hypothetical protein KDE22_08690 [Rhodobacterales bacterium]|nr:hypothetical protein [Rhodobacterales bacterium]